MYAEYEIIGVDVEMNDTQKQLLELLSHALFNRPTEITITTDIVEEAKAQAVLSLVSDNPVKLVNNIRLTFAHAELTNVLDGVPFTTFKGYASAYYYPEPIKRPMGDVDFIVDASYYSETIDRLQSAGYKQLEKEHERHITFIKDKNIFELHSEIKGIPNGLDGIQTQSQTAEGKVRELLSDLIPSSLIVDTQQGPIRIPDEFHHCLIMLLHIAGHIINDGGVGLRHICDWAVFVDRVDLIQYQKRLEEVGLWRFACQLTALCVRYLNLEAREWTGKWNDSFLGVFMDDILEAGNFGKKDPGRILSSRLERNSIWWFVENRYPITRRVSILKPLFAVVLLIRRGLLLLSGKRKRIKLSTIIGAEKRENLYRQFGLFENPEIE